MHLTETEIKDRLAADFSGHLLFQPLTLTAPDNTAPQTRPVALLASVAQLLPGAGVINSAAPAESDGLSDLLVDTLRVKSG